MTILILYNSTNALSIAAMAVPYTEYNNADNTVTVKDTNGMSLSQLNTYITNLSDEAYDKIYSFVNDTRVEETVSQGKVTITEGAVNEVGFLMVDNGVDDKFPIGYVISDASGSYHDAILLAASINSQTDVHGYSASRTDDVLTISAPAGTGAGGDSYALSSDVTHGGTLDIAITEDFGVTTAGVTAVGSSGDLSEEYFVDLEAKISDDPINSGTAQAGANTTITLASGASTTNDYYNDMVVLITANTGANQCRVITDYVGSTLVATVDTAWGTNPDATSTYIISDDLISCGRTVSSQNRALRAWEYVHTSSVNAPQAIAFISDYLYPMRPIADYTGTATAGASTTLTDSGQSWTVDALIGMWIGIKSGTGAGQTREITDNDATSVTVAAWDTNPSTDSVYQIHEYGEDYLFLDVAMEYYIKTYLKTPSTKTAQAEAWQRILDRGQYDGNYSKVSDSADESPYQDLDYLWDTIIAEGKAMHQYSLL